MPDIDNLDRVKKIQSAINKSILSVYDELNGITYAELLLALSRHIERLAAYYMVHRSVHQMISEDDSDA